MSARSKWVAVCLVSTLFVLSGCGVWSHDIANQSTPDENNQITTVQPQTFTYAIQADAPLPAQVLADLRSKSTVPVAVPDLLPSFTSPPLPHYDLAADADVSSKGYDLTLFWRPQGSHTSNYDLADLIGYISASQSPRIQHIAPTAVQRQQQMSVHLTGGITAMEYPHVGSQNVSMITWSSHNWTYLTYGLPHAAGFVKSTSLGMADTLSSNLALHGVILPHVEHGFVQETILSDRPLVVVTWTYNNRVWYTVSLQNLEESLSAARTATLLHG